MIRHPQWRVRAGVAGLLALASLSMTAPAAAATVTWTDWTSVSLPNSTASGTLGSTTVTLNGPNTGGSTTGTFTWGPSSTYVGGVVGNAPCTGTTNCQGDMINLLGGTPPVTETLTFSSPVSNPVFAVWSLGSSGTPATLNFSAGTPSIQSTGPNNIGSGTLTVNGSSVTGREGNGTFLLPGTYSTIAFTASFENYYGFTVGQAGPLAAAVPEPGTIGLIAAGLAGLVGRRRKAKTDNA